jgi:hypothetical protein
MDRHEVIEQLESDDIVDRDNNESEPLAGLEISERLRASVASVSVKVRKDGRPVGDKEVKRGRTTAKQKAFASLIVQGHSPREAYAKPMKSGQRTLRAMQAQRTSY